MSGARRTALVLTVVAVAVVAAVGTRLGDGATGEADDLARRLAATEEPDRFGFAHRAGGTRVLDCFLRNRHVSGAVDYEAGVAVLRDSAGNEIARKRPDRVLLHRDLFADGAVPTTWLRLPLPVGDELRAGLTTTLGTEVAGYVLTAGLPPSGRATALAALDAAEAVDRLAQTTIEGRRSDGYRITVRRGPVRRSHP